MSYVIKSGAVQPDDEGRCVVSVRPYNGAAPRQGDEVFLWLSETQGGHGLAHRGRLLGAGEGDVMPLAVQIEASCPPKTLSKSDLAAAMDASEQTPLRRLAEKLYLHAHNKVAALDADEGALLASCFTQLRDHGRYAPLDALLRSQQGKEFVLSFDEIEAALSASLPPSAERPQWWANTVDAHTNVQREAWRRAGFDAFLVAGQRKVRFRRV